MHNFFKIYFNFLIRALAIRFLHARLFITKLVCNTLTAKEAIMKKLLVLLAAIIASSNAANATFIGFGTGYHQVALPSTGQVISKSVQHLTQQ